MKPNSLLNLFYIKQIYLSFKYFTNNKKVLRRAKCQNGKINQMNRRKKNPSVQVEESLMESFIAFEKQKNTIMKEKS